jgi:tryptophan synthase alpha chain
MPEPGFFTAGARPGLAVFVNAGDPPLTVLPELATALDELGVDCLELAVPFPRSCTDGPTVRRSAARALAAGTGLAATLDAVGAVRSVLRTMRVALLADWSHTVRPLGLPEFVRTVAGGAVDALLLHGLPPVSRQAYLELAGSARLPVVTSCYRTSPPAVLARAGAAATAFVYLVAGHGRSGATVADHHRLGPAVAALRTHTTAPIAVGFGVRSRNEVSGVAAAGADAAVVGSATVAVVEAALAAGDDVVSAVARFVTGLRTGSTERSTSS